MSKTGSAAGVAGVGICAVIAIGFLAGGAQPVYGPDGRVDPQATASQSWDRGTGEVGDALGDGIDRTTTGIVDAGSNAILGSDIAKGTAAVATGVAVGHAVRRWRLNQDGTITEESEPAEPESDAGEPYRPSTLPDWFPEGLDDVDGPVFDLGEPPVLVGADDMDLGGDLAPLPGFVIDFTR